jgi:hypothetical protein
MEEDIFLRQLKNTMLSLDQVYLLRIPHSSCGVEGVIFLEPTSDIML